MGFKTAEHGPRKVCIMIRVREPFFGIVLCPCSADSQPAVLWHDLGGPSLIVYCLHLEGQPNCINWIVELRPLISSVKFQTNRSRYSHADFSDQGLFSKRMPIDLSS